MQAPQLELRDIHLPEAIGWWPPAVGWWILLILLPLSVYFLYCLYKHLTRKTAKKSAKKVLMQIKHNNELSDQDKLLELSKLLRRVAVSQKKRSDVASLTGRAWLDYLQSSVAGTSFTSGIGKYLADAHYQRTQMSGIDMDELTALCETWLNAQEQR